MKFSKLKFVENISTSSLRSTWNSMINRRLLDFPRRLQPFTANSQLLLHCFRSVWQSVSQLVWQSFSHYFHFTADCTNCLARPSRAPSRPATPTTPLRLSHSPSLSLSFLRFCFFSLSFSAFISYHCVCLFTPGSRFVVSGKRNVAAHCECDKTSNCGSTLAQLAASFVGRSIVPTL